MASPRDTVEKLEKAGKTTACALAALLSPLVRKWPFQQHMGSNGILRCSKCYFVIAWAAERVANSSRDGGRGFPEVVPLNSQGDTKGTERVVRGLGDLPG